MSIRALSTLGTEAFRFLVGEEKKSFLLHVKPVAELSAPLNVLMTGPMVEAKNKYAELKDVDVGTFGRFSRYLYTGDYDEPLMNINRSPRIHPILKDRNNTTYDTKLSMTIKEAAAKHPLITHEIDGKDWKMEDGYVPCSGCGLSLPIFFFPLIGTKTACQDEFTLPEPFPSSLASPALWKKFRLLDCGTPTSAAVVERYQPQKCVRCLEDFTPILFCHARIYVFADTYFIEPLKRLAIHKLHKTLCEYWLHKRRIRGIVELLQYIVGNSMHESEIQDLLAHYVACHIDLMMESRDFVAFLVEGGPIVPAIMAYVLEEARNPESITKKSVSFESP